MAEGAGSSQGGDRPDRVLIDLRVGNGPAAAVKLNSPGIDVGFAARLPCEGKEPDGDPAVKGLKHGGLDEHFRQAVWQLGQEVGAVQDTLEVQGTLEAVEPAQGSS